MTHNSFCAIFFTAMVSIYKYLDYRDWLKALFEEKKKESPHFTYRLLGSKVKLDPSFLAKVMSGKRDLSPKSVVAIASYFSLTASETDYFQKLLCFSKAKETTEKQELFDELLTLRHTSSRTIFADQYEFYSQWYYSAMRNLLQVYRFDGTDYRSLGQALAPAITELQARNAVELLLRLELIALDDKGFYKLTELAVTTGSQWDSLAIRKYHQNNIELGKEAIDRFPKEIRDISGLTMNIGREDIPRIREMVTQFRQELIQFVNSSATPEQVYHLNMQFFPFSKGCDQ